MVTHGVYRTQASKQASTTTNLLPSSLGSVTYIISEGNGTGQGSTGEVIRRGTQGREGPPLLTTTTAAILLRYTRVRRRRRSHALAHGLVQPPH